MAGKNLFRNLLGLGFLSSAWKEFKDAVIDKEDKKFRDKHKERADKYAKAYTKNMDKEIAPGLTLRQALEAETKKHGSRHVVSKELDSRLHSKKKA